MKYSQGLFSGRYQDRPRNSTAPGERKHCPEVLTWNYWAGPTGCCSSLILILWSSCLSFGQVAWQQNLSLCCSHLTSELEDASHPWRFDLSQNCSTNFPLEWTQMGTWLSATPCLQVNPKDRAKTLPCIPSGLLTNDSKKTPGKGNAVWH